MQAVSFPKLCVFVSESAENEIKIVNSRYSNCSCLWGMRSFFFFLVAHQFKVFTIASLRQTANSLELAISVIIDSSPTVLTSKELLFKPSFFSIWLCFNDVEFCLRRLVDAIGDGAAQLFRLTEDPSLTLHTSLGDCRLEANVFTITTNNMFLFLVIAFDLKYAVSCDLALTAFDIGLRTGWLLIRRA